MSLKKICQDLEISRVFLISRRLVFALIGFTFLSLETFYQGVSDSDLSLQSWTKVLGTVLQYACFYAISRLPLKAVHHFRNFQQFPGHIQGRGWTCMNYKTPKKRKSDLRLLSMIVGSRHRGNSRILPFASRYFIYIWQVNLFDSARGGHFIKAVRCHTNK